MSLANTKITMNVKMTASTIMAIAVLASAISSSISFATMPAFAQPTVETPSFSTTPGSDTTGGSTASTGGDSGDFVEFIECLFSSDGGSVSAEDISNVLEGNAGLTPTEQEIRGCFGPIYNTGSGAGATGSSGTGGGVTTEEGADENGSESGDDDQE
jgi:hypothetical protein